MKLRNDTFDKIIRLNDVIGKHLKEEQDCSHPLKSIIQEALAEDEK